MECRRPRLPGRPSGAASRAGRWRLLVAAAALAGTGGVQAQAMLLTDTPSQVPAGGCHIEGWYEHSRGARASVSAPACSRTAPGTLAGQNLGAITPRTDLRPARAAPLPRGIVPPPPENWGVGATAKWSEPDWQLGPVRWGLKFSSFAQHLSDVGWQPGVTSLLGLASVSLPAQLQLRLNVGPRIDAVSGQAGTLLKAALQWRWNDRIQLAGEMQAAQGMATQQSIGSELWVVPGRLGLGFNAGRTVGQDGWDHYAVRVNWHLFNPRQPQRR
ncbi:MAG TPA: hypothetical protein VNO84_09655 [Burkholderiaceae bacterium]|nr:hypothetical protein [Burkholderiaceae bacterium]